MGNRILIVTDDGRVFVHDILGNTIGIPFQLDGPRVGANPQDKRVLVMGNRILVVTEDASQWNHSYPFLAVAPLSFVGLKGSWRYFAGLKANGQPEWQEHEELAQPLPPFGPLGDGSGYHECLGYFSVRRIEAWNKWVMLYSCNNDASAGYNAANGPRGIYLRTASIPWGPWSPPERIFDPDKDGYCRFMHDQRADGVGGDCSMVNPDVCRNRGTNPSEESVRDITIREKTKRAFGGEYAPFLLPSRYAKVGADHATLYFAMSTWNPYQVMLMRSTLRSDVDSDGDGLADFRELALGTDPHNPDTDGDMLSDGDEVARGTNPLNADTDEDGALDGGDNCPLDKNPDQSDLDADGVGNVCDDVAPATPPPSQSPTPRPTGEPMLTATFTAPSTSIPTVLVTPTPTLVRGSAGDANCDGVIDAADLVALIDRIASGGSPGPCGGDVDQDADADADDLSAMIELIFRP
jgi:hypothetical protein